MFKSPFKSVELNPLSCCAPGTCWALPTSGMLLHQEQPQGLCPASCRDCDLSTSCCYEVLMAPRIWSFSQASSQQRPIQPTRHWPALTAWLLMRMIQQYTACLGGGSVTVDPPWPSPIWHRQECACKANELGAMKGWIDDVPVPNSNVKFATARSCWAFKDSKGECWLIAVQLLKGLINNGTAIIKMNELCMSLENKMGVGAAFRHSHPARPLRSQRSNSCIATPGKWYAMGMHPSL